MSKISVVSLDYYNKKVIQRIVEKYGFDYMSAARAFLTSEVHSMIEDPTLETLQNEARALRKNVEGEHIIEALAKSNRSYDELLDFLSVCEE